MEIYYKVFLKNINLVEKNQLKLIQKRKRRLWDEILCIFFTFSSQIHICTYNQIFIYLQTHEATPTKTHIKCTTHHNNVIFNSCSKNKRKLLMYFCSNSVKHYLNTHHHHHSHILSVYFQCLYDCTRLWILLERQSIKSIKSVENT